MQGTAMKNANSQHLRRARKRLAEELEAHYPSLAFRRAKGAIVVGVRRRSFDPSVEDLLIITVESDSFTAEVGYGGGLKTPIVVPLAEDGALDRIAKTLSAFTKLL